METFLIVTTTFSDKDEAIAAAENLLQRRLVACAQLSKKVESLYWWKGTIEKSDEYVLSMKTKKRIYPQLEHFLKKIHSYENPEIIAVPVSHVAPDYSEWLHHELDTQEI